MHTVTSLTPHTEHGTRTHRSAHTDAHRTQQTMEPCQLPALQRRTCGHFLLLVLGMRKHAGRVNTNKYVAQHKRQHQHDKQPHYIMMLSYNIVHSTCHDVREQQIAESCVCVPEALPHSRRCICSATECICTLVLWPCKRPLLTFSLLGKVVAFFVVLDCRRES